eukprot:CAMPEP_0194361800 /NCGR_PEP_ID=MMETSP0174-20130528/9418_1 /TAXON_ID=216777 /ORGANISM="Proboscia alata, Strain PI-D3" /LENGTH=1267 /DNA_ID=CAMNT_0039134221 /DNA_START=85 /DNA_END=3889 /DNA_ORIENTATION=+
MSWVEPSDLPPQPSKTIINTSNSQFDNYDNCSASVIANRINRILSPISTSSSTWEKQSHAQPDGQQIRKEQKHHQFFRLHHPSFRYQFCGNFGESKESTISNTSYCQYPAVLPIEITRPPNSFERESTSDNLQQQQYSYSDKRANENKTQNSNYQDFTQHGNSQDNEHEEIRSYALPKKHEQHEQHEQDVFQNLLQQTPYTKRKYDSEQAMYGSGELQQQPLIQKERRQSTLQDNCFQAKGKTISAAITSEGNVLDEKNRNERDYRSWERVGKIRQVGTSESEHFRPTQHADAQVKNPAAAKISNGRSRNKSAVSNHIQTTIESILTPSMKSPMYHHSPPSIKEDENNDEKIYKAENGSLKASYSMSQTIKDTPEISQGSNISSSHIRAPRKKHSSKAIDVNFFKKFAATPKVCPGRKNSTNFHSECHKENPKDTSKNQKQNENNEEFLINDDPENDFVEKPRKRRTKKNRQSLCTTKRVKECYAGDDCKPESIIPGSLPKRTRSKKSKRSSSSAHNVVIPRPTINLTEKSFWGIDQHGIYNAARSLQSLQVFLQMAKSQKFLTWTIIYLDEELSTPFYSSCKRYCTLKGPTCCKWNCTCDGQVRAMQCKKPLLGVMFVFPYDDNPTPSPDLSEQSTHNVEKLKGFILPLGRCNKSDGNPEQVPSEKILSSSSPSTQTSTNNVNKKKYFARMKKWPPLPFECECPIDERWSAFRSILLHQDGRDSLRCVTFNALLGIMPFHYHRITDICKPMDLIIKNVWDLKLAAWMLRPHATEQEIEFETFEMGYSHLKPSTKSVNSFDTTVSKELSALIKVKEQLSFLYALYPIISASLNRKNLSSSLDQIEGPLQSVLASMEVSGIGFLPNRLHGIQEKLEARIKELNDLAKSIARDETFMLSSPQQVAHLLYDILRVKAPESRGGKQSLALTSSRSTSEAVLKTIKLAHDPPLPIIDTLLEFRALNKLLTTYIRPLPTLKRELFRSRTRQNDNEKVYRIHPMWMQTSVRTGRLSCRKPNMQQIPTNGAFGISPRDAFCASSPDWCLFACDYSQNEIRILAHMSNDSDLIAMFNNENSVDIYKQMSSAITSKPVEKVSSKERGIAKQVVLAILYGMGKAMVAKKLCVSLDTAQKFFTSFFNRFRGVRKWIDDTKESAKELGFVTTIVGRRRYLDDIRSDCDQKRSQAERQAVNSIIQGSAADLMKLAMLKMADRIVDWKKESLDSGGRRFAPNLILQIHDELLFEVITNDNDISLLKNTVTGVVAMNVKEIWV